MDWKGQKRGCGQTSLEGLAVAREGNVGSLELHGSGRGGERRAEINLGAHEIKLMALWCVCFFLFFCFFFLRQGLSVSRRLVM